MNPKRTVLSRGKVFRAMSQLKPAIFVVSALAAVSTQAAWEEISFEDFENGFVEWEDGGNDVFLRQNTAHRSSGVNSANIQDGSGPKSTIRQKAFDATEFSELEISFWYKPISMELGEFFRIQFQKENGKWANLVDYVKGEDFVKNGNEYSASLTISTDDYPFGSASRFRIRNFANTNADDIYIDDILVRGNRTGSATPSVTPTPTSTPTATPTPTVTPTPTPTPTIASAAGDFCLSTDGVVSHADKPFRANYHYICMGSNCQPATLAAGVWTHDFGDVTENQGYTVKMQMDDFGGECGMTATLVPGQCVASDCLPPDVDAPTTPGDFTATAKNGHAIELSWSASTDDRGVARYNIYRDGNLIGSPSVTWFNAVDLPELTTFTFAVEACDDAGNCSSLTEATESTPQYVPDRNGPTVPSGITGVPGLRTMALSWNASSDTEGLVAQYDVYRDGNLLGSTAEVSFDDSGLESSTSYSYSVRACDDSGNCSARSKTLNISTESPSYDHLDWTSNSFSNGAVGALPRNDGPQALLTPVMGVAPTTYGFAFDLNDNAGTVTWRWGAIMATSGLDRQNLPDSGLTMFCSEDNHKTFKSSPFSGLVATIPCRGDYDYFFRYNHEFSLNNDPAHRYIYTGLFTTSGIRIDPYSPARGAFTDGSANWMRFRHPIAHDGITAAVLDAQHNGGELRQLDRYPIWVNDDPVTGLDFELIVDYYTDDPELAGFRRNEAGRQNAAGGPNGQQFYMVNTNPDNNKFMDIEQREGFGTRFSYGQVVSYEISVEGAGTFGSGGQPFTAQSYNDFSHYIVGCGYCGKYGDPRLNPAGKATTSQVFADGAFAHLEYNAIFTQPVTTFHTEDQIDNWIVGHHLFHGVDPNKKGSTTFDDPDVQIGDKTCGNCHFRDGRGAEPVMTPKGLRLPPPVYGVKLLEVIEGRESGFTWDGMADTVEDQIKNALRDDHGVNWQDLPGEVFQRLVDYTEGLTVPARNPGVYDNPKVEEGELLFDQVGCAGCHTPVQRTRADVEPAYRNLTLRPYTDMKNHDLGDGSFRTAPLWGIGQNIALLERNGYSILYMHDGASATVHHAVQRHGGASQDSTDLYNDLTSAQQEAIEAFVESL